MLQGCMKTLVVVIILECVKLSLQIDRVPEQCLIKKLTTNGPDRALDEWVWKRSQMPLVCGDCAFVLVWSISLIARNNW